MKFIQKFITRRFLSLFTKLGIIYKMLAPEDKLARLILNVYYLSVLGLFKGNNNTALLRCDMVLAWNIEVLPL